MTLENISDNVLLDKTEKLVASERNMLSQVLLHLKEIDRRRLFSKLGYQSLFDYAVKKLKYSEDQAGRRIAAMRLARELPQISEKIEDGSLTLSNIGMASSFFRHESKVQGFDMPEFQKLELLEELNGKTYREAQKIVLQKSSEPETLRPEKVRYLSDSKIEIRFMADASLIERLNKVKGLIAHSKPNLTMAELVEFMADLTIKNLDPGLKAMASKKKPKENNSDHSTNDEVRTNSKTELLSETRNEPSNSAKDVLQDKCSEKLKLPAAPRVRIPNATRRQIWILCQSQCSNCQSVHALEIEHIKPWSMGGTNDAENLTLLCRSCNQRSAIDQFGIMKMQSHLIQQKSSASG
jgi:5-methylcytosine-specific restriction endonuclease McrA